MPRTPAYPEIVADLAALFGLSRPAGQCFAAIWRAAQPPCADDLTGQCPGWWCRRPRAEPPA